MVTVWLLWLTNNNDPVTPGSLPDHRRVSVGSQRVSAGRNVFAHASLNVCESPPSLLSARVPESRRGDVDIRLRGLDGRGRAAGHVQRAAFVGSVCAAREPDHRAPWVGARPVQRPLAIESRGRRPGCPGRRGARTCRCPGGRGWIQRAGTRYGIASHLGCPQARASGSGRAAPWASAGSA